MAQALKEASEKASLEKAFDYGDYDESRCRVVCCCAQRLDHAARAYYPALSMDPRRRHRAGPKNSAKERLH